MWKSDRAVPARQNGRVNPIRCRPQVSCWNRVRSVNFRVLEVYIQRSCIDINIHIDMYAKCSRPQQLQSGAAVTPTHTHTHVTPTHCAKPNISFWSSHISRELSQVVWPNIELVDTSEKKGVSVVLGHHIFHPLCAQPAQRLIPKTRFTAQKPERCI